MDNGTGIQPTFRVIDTDGTNLYIENGKKLITH